MPRFNFTFQEASPLIAYNGLWMEGGSQNDTSASLYDGGFRVTNSSDATAILNFNGTGVAIFGALRDNHGNYSINLDHDNGNPSVVDGLGDAFNKTLWQAYGLGYGRHTVEVTNGATSARPYFDLDYVTIERQIGQDSDTIYNLTYDDTSPFVQYSRDGWQSLTMQSQTYDGTIHQTTEIDSHLTVTFQGCCIELYGLYANAGYIVSVDNQTAEEMHGMDIDLEQSMWHPQTLLYLVDGLPEDMDHTITVTTVRASVSRPFFFDYAVTSSAQRLPSHAPLALILGLSIGGTVLLALLITAFVLLRRRRREARMAHMAEADPYIPQPWIRLEQGRPIPRQPSTFQLSSVVSGWRHIPGDGQTSSGNSQSPQLQVGGRMWDSLSMRMRRRSSVTPAVPRRNGKGRQFAVASSPVARFSRQSFVTSDMPSQAEDAGPVIPPAYDPEWDGSH